MDSQEDQGISTSEAVQHLAKAELLAYRVAQQRRTLVALDERRQKLRESEGILRKSKIQGSDTWVCLGQTTFIEFPTKTACELLAKDRQVVGEAIDETNIELRKDVDELLKLEKNKNLSDRGFDLQAINSNKKD